MTFYDVTCLNTFLQTITVVNSMKNHTNNNLMCGASLIKQPISKWITIKHKQE